MDPNQPRPPPSRGRARGRPVVASSFADRAVGQIQQPMADVRIQDDPPGPSQQQQGFIQQEVGASGGEGEPQARSSTRTEAEKEVWEEFMKRRDYLNTKPAYLQSKRGDLGAPMPMVANYFPVLLKGNQNWTLKQYRVDFQPDQDNTFIRKVLVRKLVEQLPAYIFDGGNMMYSQVQLPINPMILTSIFNQKDGSEDIYEITIKLTREVAWNDPAAFQFFNIVVRKSLEMSKNLTLMGRFYFDHEEKVAIPTHRLEVWPGYKTVMRPHEDRILLNVEMVSKVVRTETAFRLMQQIREFAAPDQMRSKVEEAICGRVVMTSYNRKTYNIDSILWDVRPTATFETRDGPVTYIEYYKNRYAQTIREERQPLLCARPSKRDIHRGIDKPIILVPELCQLTGLTEDMRSDFKLMNDLKKHLFLEPPRRVELIQSFMRAMVENQDLKKELVKWGVKYNTNELIEVPGRQLPAEKIIFARGVEFTDNQTPADWTKAFRSQQLLAPVPMKKWAIIVPQRDTQNLDKLIQTLKNVSTPLGFVVGVPKTKMINGIGPPIYGRAIDELMAESQGIIDLIFIILPNNQLGLYSSVKQKCAVQYGVPSQCFLSKNALKANMSVCTKVAIQMCAKLGGEPWSIVNPLSKANCMVVGYDVYHTGAGSTSGKSVGAMVASINPSITKYTSTVTMAQKNELSASVGSELLKLLMKYKEVNLRLPSRIIFYRDGVGEGQLSQVQDLEIGPIDDCLNAIYGREALEIPKFTFIVVSKRINTRLMLKTNMQYANPPPGSVVDDVVTLPERYDFYLISQSARQGTVSPTSYNVLRDHDSLKPNHLQMFTFKMCHLYYNWSGTVAVPAVCQYAHKLAYLTGLSLNAPAHSNLSNLLHFL